MGPGLRKVFDFLPEDKVESLSGYLTEKRIECGGVLFRAGEVADAVYFIAGGRCAVKKFTGFEDRMQVVALLGQGAVIGENSWFPERKRTTTVIAVEDSLLGVLSVGNLRRIKDNDYGLFCRLIEKFLEISGKRLDACTERLAHIL